ncbi:hypothetical protein KQX54_005615 [Cotesia glomerata]|uniref:Uncharacterized protein n=1 Tax=Cotesia glomerata TaxID=32391 RepID=A0AAV7I785_COTGL|nr:hypothetical protein KQX54_005615 [Cotesia glomerata]
MSKGPSTKREAIFIGPVYSSPRMPASDISPCLISLSVLRLLRDYHYGSTDMPELAATSNVTGDSRVKTREKEGLFFWTEATLHGIQLLRATRVFEMKPSRPLRGGRFARCALSRNLNFSRFPG